MAENTTRMLYLIKLVEVIDELGYPIDEVLHAAGLTSIDLNDGDRQLTISKYVTAIEAATTICPVPDLGFQVGARTELVEHGVLGYALLSGATLQDCLQRYVRYQYLQGPLLSVELNTEGDNAKLIARPVLNHIGTHQDVLRYVIQEWLVGWNQLTPLVGAHGFFFSNADVGLPVEIPTDRWANHLGCTVSFSSDETTASFPGEFLRRPLNFSDQAVTKLCDEQCERILKELDLGHGLIAEVHRLLAATPGTVPNMESVANRLFMNARTLRRRLLSEGTTYQNVVADFRLAIAKRFLVETSLPANAIADLVGYADPANLYRAFRSSTQMTPQQYRLQADTPPLLI